MKILGICGSPRKGNTEFMIQTVLESARKNGCETDLVLLKDQKIDFCKGDMTCYKSTKGCCIKDDMRDLCCKLLSNDIYVVGTPSYFDLPTARLKNFMDRTNPLCGKLAKKQAVIVAVGAAGMPSVKSAAAAAETWCHIHKIKVLKTYLANGKNMADVKNSRKVVQDLQRIGASLAS
jgi:multimeric flavodoxin WrbA